MLADRRHWRLAIIAMIVFVLGRAMSLAQVPTKHPATGAQSQIRALMTRLDDPATRDASKVQSIFADTFYAVQANGNLLSKAEWLAVRSRLRIRTVEWETTRFFEYGDAVVVQGDVHRTYEMPDGRPVDERRRMTLVWVHRDGRWQLAAQHGTSLAP